jgi:DNA-binding transcriptional regulator YiaG
MATAIKHSRVQSKIRKPVSGQSAGVEVRDLRRRHGLSQGLLARLLDVSLRTVSGLESGSVVPVQLRRNLVQVNRLCGALTEAMESSYVGRWLDEPNEMLGSLKPVEAVERGQIDLVWQVIEGLRSGSQL